MAAQRPPQPQPDMADVIVISSSPSSSPSPPPEARNEGPIGPVVDDDFFPPFNLHDIEQVEQPPQPEPEFPSPDQCLAMLLGLFPDIDHTYVMGLYEKNFENVQLQGLNMVDFLADQILETNGGYPKLKREDRAAKRKREQSPSEMNAQELEDKYCNDPTRFIPSMPVRQLSSKLLRNAFPLIPAAYIDQELSRSRYYIFGAFQALAQAESKFDADPAKPYKKLTRVRKAVPDELLKGYVNQIQPEEYNSFMEELRQAKRIYEPITFRGGAGAGPADRSDEELVECGCCFGEVPPSQATQCTDGHLFCLQCGKQNAKTEIGQQRYKLFCMDTSGCRKEFSPREIRRFCDEKMVSALERFEQRDMIMKAGIEDLVECPFCEFALIMQSSAEDDKEFRCQNPECGQISCRLCSKVTHIPYTCEESAKNKNENLRKDVEEAMTQALLRKCGKCSLPYVKESSGCNKIICTRCGAMNCYLCSKVIRDYNHFNDPARGGRSGNCLLFDNTEERHHNEVEAAERAAIAKIRAENPEITEEQMRVQLSQVIIDDERQKIEAGNRHAPRAQIHHGRIQHMPPGRFPLGQPAPPPVLPPEPGPNVRQVLQVMNPMIRIPFQPMLQVPAAFPLDPGFRIGVPMYQLQMLRNPMIQVNPLPHLGNAVPFQGAPGYAPPPPQPLNFIQRFMQRPPAAPIPAPPQPQMLDGIYGVALQGPFNQYGFPIAQQPVGLQPHEQVQARAQAELGARLQQAQAQVQQAQLQAQQGQAQAQAYAQARANGNLGFIHRNFGGNRLVARGRQAAHNRAIQHPQLIPDNGNDVGGAANAAVPDLRAGAPATHGAKPAPAPDFPVVRRPAKIMKRK
ncbi:hypothetical protein TWF102_011289 [Orbilia oligospora]|uniref:RING-type domain-containing protein n=1 Tax=Orbilia oligospora TaxID=2813651 RepID=A0A7C8N3E0_ORBOL|nr:hypothetical protein TWF102_011289 [Orbilia oligospora]KAF3148297.1 hypothetical protein TWF594_001484 [Orbilia oligospora]